MQSGPVTLDGSFVVSYQHTLTIKSSNLAPWYLPKGAENFCSLKTLHTDVCSILMYNRQTWKQPKCLSISETGGAFRQWNSSTKKK